MSEPIFQVMFHFYTPWKYPLLYDRFCDVFFLGGGGGGGGGGKLVENELIERLTIYWDCWRWKG